MDAATGFSDAAVLMSSTVGEVCTVFVNVWATLYPGFPNTLRVDSVNVITSPRWIKCTDSDGSQLQLSGVEIHNSVGIG